MIGDSTMAQVRATKSADGFGPVTAFHVAGNALTLAKHGRLSALTCANLHDITVGRFGFSTAEMRAMAAELLDWRQGRLPARPCPLCNDERQIILESRLMEPIPCPRCNRDSFDAVFGVEPVTDGGTTK